MLRTIKAMSASPHFLACEKKFLLGMFSITLACSSLPCLGDDPATQPAPQAQPAVSNESIKRWFDQLADADPHVRDEATNQLMQLKLDDLAMLRKVVQEELPLTPTQMEALPDIVAQVYLAGQPYEAQGDKGFLGIQTSVVDIASSQEDPDGRKYTGILVARRVTGFCAARALRNGDLIVGIDDSPKQGFIDALTFRDAVMSHPAGSTVHFQVLRRGQILEVPITLDARPVVANLEDGLQRLTQQRQQVFDRYWAENFAPLLKEEVSSAATPAGK
jgi:C-terminal processing protease CtpA/Prc